MESWIDRAKGLEGLGHAGRARLEALRPNKLPAGAVIFRPGDEATGFVVVLAGRVGVYLTGPTGREILLYTVTPGQTCVQTTLGLLGEKDYAGEAVAETDVVAVIVPKSVFLEMMAADDAFRGYVFRAFAARLNSIMQVLERVAFIKVEERLAAVLLERADDEGRIRHTHQELAAAIGSVREVVSRRLEALAKQGLVSLERGDIRILDPRGLQALIRYAA